MDEKLLLGSEVDRCLLRAWRATCAKRLSDKVSSDVLSAAHAKELRNEISNIVDAIAQGGLKSSLNGSHTQNCNSQRKTDATKARQLNANLRRRTSTSDSWPRSRKDLRRTPVRLARRCEISRAALSK
jgi:hypothetical protein